MTNRWGIPQEVEMAVIARDSRCIYCGVEFGETRATKRSWEHIVNDIRISTIENIALCCVGCNASKGAKDLKTWLNSNNAIRRGITSDTFANVVREALERDKNTYSVD